MREALTFLLLQVRQDALGFGQAVVRLPLRVLHAITKVLGPCFLVQNSGFRLGEPQTRGGGFAQGGRLATLHSIQSRRLGEEFVRVLTQEHLQRRVEAPGGVCRAGEVVDRTQDLAHLTTLPLDLGLEGIELPTHFLEFVARFIEPLGRRLGLGLQVHHLHADLLKIRCRMGRTHQYSRRHETTEGQQDTHRTGTAPHPHVWPPGERLVWSSPGTWVGAGTRLSTLGRAYQDPGSLKVTEW